MSTINIYISEELKVLIEERIESLDIEISDYFRMLAIFDISEEKLKLLHCHEKELLDNINSIKEQLEV